MSSMCKIKTILKSIFTNDFLLYRLDFDIYKFASKMNTISAL